MAPAIRGHNLTPRGGGGRVGSMGNDADKLDQTKELPDFFYAVRVNGRNGSLWADMAEAIDYAKRLSAAIRDRHEKLLEVTLELDDVDTPADPPQVTINIELL